MNSCSAKDMVLSGASSFICPKHTNMSKNGWPRLVRKGVLVNFKTEKPRSHDAVVIVNAK
jgi:hypothetical protein